MVLQKYTIFAALLAFGVADAAANSARDGFVSSRTKLPSSTSEEVGVPYNQSDRELDGTSSPRPKLGKERNVQVGVPYDKVDREIDRNKVGDKSLYRRAQKKEKTETEAPNEGASDLLGIE